MQVVAGFKQIYREILQSKDFENPLTFDRIMAVSFWPNFFGPTCMCAI